MKKYFFVLTLAIVAACVQSATTKTVRATETPLIVVCESGTFKPVADAKDPYVRESSDGCNLKNVNGRAVIVKIID